MFKKDVGEFVSLAAIAFFTHSWSLKCTKLTIYVFNYRQNTYFSMKRSSFVQSVCIDLVKYTAVPTANRLTMNRNKGEYVGKTT